MMGYSRHRQKKNIEASKPEFPSGSNLLQDGGVAFLNSLPRTDGALAQPNFDKLKSTLDNSKTLQEEAAILAVDPQAVRKKNIRQAVWDDKNASFKYVANSPLAGIGGLASGIQDLMASILGGLGVKDEAEYEKMIKSVREQNADLREAPEKVLGFDISKKDRDQASQEFLTSTFRGLGESLPAMLTPYGAGLYIQAYDNGIQQINNSEEGAKLPEWAKSIYGGTVGAAQGALEKVGLNKVIKSPKVLKGVTDKIVNNVFGSLAKTGEKATAEAVEKMVSKEASAIAARLRNAGSKGLSAFATESATGGLQETAQILTEIATNQATGKEIFNIGSFGENIGRIAKSAAQEGVGGFVLGGAIGGLSRTQAAIRDEIANASTPEDMATAVTDAMETIQADDNISPADTEALSQKVQQYQEIAPTIPETVPPQQKAQIMDEIANRNEIDSAIQEKTAEMESVDEAFRPQVQKDIDILNKQREDVDKNIQDILNQPVEEVIEETLIEPENEQTPIREEAVADVQVEPEQPANEATDSVAPVEVENIAEEVKLKEEPKNAIQEQRPNEVDVRQQAENGEKMGEGNAKAKTVAEQGKESVEQKIKTSGEELEVPSLKDTDFKLAVVEIPSGKNQGKFGVFETNSGKLISNVYEGREELLSNFEKVKDKITPEALAAKIKPDITIESEKEPLTNKQKAKDIADKLRGLKTDKGKVYGGLQGVGVAVYDGALETAATIIEAGGSVADALQAAVRHIKASSENKNYREIYYSLRKDMQSAGLIERSDIDYSKELKDAKQSQRRIITKGKSDELLQSLGEIDPRYLTEQEIVKYNDIVNKQNPARDEIAKFIDDVHARQDAEAQEREADWYKQFRNEEDAAEIESALKSKTNKEGDISDEAKDTKAKKALKKLLRLGKKDLRSAEIPKEYDVIRKAILDLDESKLNTKQLRDLNRDVESMIYDGNFAGIGKWLALDESAKKSADILDRLNKLGFKTNTTSKIASQLRSVDQNLETILRTSKGASLVQANSGIHDISAGNARVNEAMNQTTKRFHKMLDGMPSEIQNVENRYKRGILALFAQQNTGLSTEQHFEQYKERVEKTAERLIKDESESKSIIGNIGKGKTEGELVKYIYDKFIKDATSSEDVIEAFAKDNPNNTKIVKFFIDEFSKVYSGLRKNTLLYSGKDLPSIENYTATSFKRLKDTDASNEMEIGESIIDPVSMDVQDLSTDTGQSRTTIGRKGGMPKGMALNLDFDALQLNKLRESRYDIETLAPRYLYDAIRKQPDFIKALGDNQTNVNVLSSGVKDMVTAQRGFNTTDPIARKVLSATGILRKTGVRLALKGIDQLAKQYIPVATNTMLNLGPDLGLYFKAMGAGLNNPIFNESGIGLRKLQAGGTEFENRLRTSSKNDFANFANARNWISNKLNYADRAFGSALSFSDDAVARHSWLAYYLQDLKNQGIDVNSLDMGKLSDNINKEAAAYAEQMVSRNQVPNDPTKNAAIVRRGDVNNIEQLGKEVLKDMVLPFTTFARNTQNRVFNDIRKFNGGDKKEAAVSLIASAVESAMFNTIKVGLAVYIYNQIQDELLQSFGFEKGKEKEINPEEIAANVLDDLVLAGMGTVADNVVKKTINSAFKTATGNSKSEVFKVYDPTVFGETDWSLAGVYGILPQQGIKTGKAFQYAFGTPKDRDREGREYETNLTDRERKLAKYAFTVDMLATMGLTGAGAGRIASQVTSQIDRQRKPTQYFGMKVHNSRSGSVKTDTDASKPDNKIKTKTGRTYELSSDQIAERQSLTELYLQKNEKRLRPSLEKKALYDKGIMKKMSEKKESWDRSNTSQEDRAKFKKSLVDEYVTNELRKLANKNSEAVIYRKYKGKLTPVEE